MIKLLIVEDELITRRGLIKNISKQDLGIDYIEQADDGINALGIAKRFLPDIVLTDIRMPRMDGITMAFKIREILPDCKIVFMSAYSDKDYLKSAIQLKVISYVEKPINADELISTLRQTVKICKDEESERQNKLQLQDKLVKSIPFIRNEMALQLKNSNNNFKILEEHLNSALPDFANQHAYITVLFKLTHSSNLSSADFNYIKEEINNSLSIKIASIGLKGVSAYKDDEYLIAHLSSSSDYLHHLDRKYLQVLLTDFFDSISFDKLLIAVGKKVTKLIDIPTSYTTAVIALQKSFFTGYRTINFYETNNGPVYELNEDLVKIFNESIALENQEKAIYIIHNLTSDLRNSTGTLVNYAKDIYYRLMQQLLRSSKEFGLILFQDNEIGSFLWHTFSAFETLDEVHRFSINKIQLYFSYLKEKKSGSSAITEIIKYIHKNYIRADLTIKEISNNIRLSSTYICYVFKQEKGITINQYITGYRVEKAKEFLKDKAMKVSDISEKVGYTEGNYFVRIFKKHTGFNPSEYRERCQ